MEQRQLRESYKPGLRLLCRLQLPHVRKKMSVEEFCRGHRGINDGEDLPREYLEAMFARILGEPFDVTEPDGDPSGQPAEPRRCALGSGRCGLM
mmetsp:Transcript_59010/g.118021  ORF Transcript_59010/g.118021 Transcript_59010/m.118021 type:complete len:94 (-) Transcript_59010:206-487(-)